MSDHENDPALAEAIARRDESRAQILRSKAQASGATSDALAKALNRLADQAAEDAKKSADAAANIEPARPDPEGTARPLADSEGNFPANAEVAAVGGIGIDASNTNVETGEPAKTAEEAGKAIMPGAQKIVGDQPLGGDAEVIPDDWADQHWQKQVKLAERISGQTDMSAAQAREFLGAEVERRKTPA